MNNENNSYLENSILESIDAQRDSALYYEGEVLMSMYSAYSKAATIMELHEDDCDPNEYGIIEEQALYGLYMEDGETPGEAEKKNVFGKIWDFIKKICAKVAAKISGTDPEAMKKEIAEMQQAIDESNQRLSQFSEEEHNEINSVMDDMAEEITERATGNSELDIINVAWNIANDKKNRKAILYPVALAKVLTSNDPKIKAAIEKYKTAKTINFNIMGKNGNAVSTYYNFEELENFWNKRKDEFARLAAWIDGCKNETDTSGNETTANTLDVGKLTHAGTLTRNTSDTTNVNTVKYTWTVDTTSNNPRAFEINMLKIGDDVFKSELETYTNCIWNKKDGRKEWKTYKSSQFKNLTETLINNIDGAMDDLATIANVFGYGDTANRFDRRLTDTEENQGNIKAESMMKDRNFKSLIDQYQDAANNLYKFFNYFRTKIKINGKTDECNNKMSYMYMTKKTGKESTNNMYHYLDADAYINDASKTDFLEKTAFENSHKGTPWSLYIMNNNFPNATNEIKSENTSSGYVIAKTLNAFGLLNGTDRIQTKIGLNDIIKEGKDEGIGKKFSDLLTAVDITSVKTKIKNWLNRVDDVLDLRLAFVLERVMFDDIESQLQVIQTSDISDEKKFFNAATDAKGASYEKFKSYYNKFKNASEFLLTFLNANDAEVNMAERQGTNKIYKSDIQKDITDNTNTSMLQHGVYGSINNFTQNSYGIRQMNNKDLNELRNILYNYMKDAENMLQFPSLFNEALLINNKVETIIGESSNILRKEIDEAEANLERALNTVNLAFKLNEIKGNIQKKPTTVQKIKNLIGIKNK